MAINLEDKENVQAPDSDYPYGQIKDDSGSGDGTPVDVAVYGDFHQFFARMFALSGLVYNGLPDNAYTGFQYIEAANRLWKTYIGVKTVSDEVSDTLTVADMGKLIYADGNSTAKIIILPVISTLEEADSITIFNNSASVIEVRRGTGDTINGDVNIYLNDTYDFVTLVAESATNTWKIAAYKVTAPAQTPIYAISFCNGTTHVSTTSFVANFNNIIYDPNTIIDTSNGKITPNVAGVYEVSYDACMIANGAFGTGSMTSQVNKNGTLTGYVLDRQDVTSSDTNNTTKGSMIVAFNGTTDYIEVVVNFSVASSINLFGGVNIKKIAG